MTGNHGVDVSGHDGLTNLALLALGAVIAAAGILRLAGNVAAFASGAKQPTGGLGAGFGVFSSPADPGIALGSTALNPLVYWSVVTALVALVAVVAWWVWRVLRDHTRHTKSDPHRIVGIATSTDVRHAASERALLSRAAHLRASVAKPQPEDVGYLVGVARGAKVWTSVEDSILVIGPPRSGKGAHIVINAILDAPGAVVTTSTRPDNLTTTIRSRMRRGPVAVFDPQHLAPGVPAGLRWSPVRGCEVPLTAMIRAAGLAAGTGLSGVGVENGGFWEGKTRTALQALLHAAALDGRSPGELFRWTLDPATAKDAVAILTNNPAAATGWAESLDAMIDADPRTRDSIWQGVSLALAALADPRVLDAVSPSDDEQFDPETFLRRNGTLYLLATGAGAGASSSLVAALVEDLVETARRVAARSPGARLDPPLLLALDEIGNLAPLPSLPVLMAEGGGTGITTMPVLQSLAQARQRWGDNAATAIWDASIAKIVLGGASGSRDLQDLSTLIGDRDEVTDSITVGERGLRSSQRSTRRVPIMPPDVIRTLPYGTALLMLRAAPPIVTRMREWGSRPNGALLREDRARVEEQLRRG
ncbi:type IV secretory system conjugative DNA transfer family protein [Microbacterium sp. Sa4CUA7]|uniref:Type IV secretory system conjugative DNA transfer family protein n=1 Tax=Microbacterium pullorum TaxID=2762236 RepID=A0ABR8S569_9MICO|nr:TraM recognition domain-containing protein [Microbacterium pullorum]MBD7958616.1 type IV secretory system conjugative DNA transfer family protein [Microbacterium pullorum]